MDEEQVPPDLMRAGDIDRDAVTERLTYAFQEGRLTLDEYHERLDRAMRAVVMRDLAPLTSDLPAPPPPAPRTESEAGQEVSDERQERWRQRLEPWRGLAAISVILVGIWGVTSVISGELLPFWPLIPIGFMFMFTLAGAVGGTYLDGSEQRSPLERPDSDDP
ncbi:uncharacterized protein DUF1707 [Haloactinospora alba]|uniref:Uncharacterized protein DUF1707 n=1 Tax=Haloactinospora alba TaxID=405555 RepID=A0A543NKE1_9ACTN|nr:DUF1707 domain-containing protein [Haloactinospora alba]TQN32266.1 uncharacterized protein DUF1707 [Haloactinospora alba]